MSILNKKAGTGNSISEYAVLASVGFLTILASVQLFGDNLNRLFSNHKQTMVRTAVAKPDISINDYGLAGNLSQKKLDDLLKNNPNSFTSEFVDVLGSNGSQIIRNSLEVMVEDITADPLMSEDDKDLLTDLANSAHEIADVIDILNQFSERYNNDQAKLNQVNIQLKGKEYNYFELGRELGIKRRSFSQILTNYRDNAAGRKKTSQIIINGAGEFLRPFYEMSLQTNKVQMTEETREKLDILIELVVGVGDSVEDDTDAIQDGEKDLKDSVLAGDSNAGEIAEKGARGICNIGSRRDDGRNCFANE
ncbi:MAG: hypothetical protein AAGI66_03750 [Cyanobacteria bacterium P01_H01_bin.74]